MFYCNVLQGFIFIFIAHISFSKPNLTVYVRLITLSQQSENSNLSRKDVLKIEIVRAFVTKIPYTFVTETENNPSPFFEKIKGSAAVLVGTA